MNWWFTDDCGRLLGSRVEGVLLTHAHFDHIYGLPLLLEKFPDVAIYTNEWGKAALADKQNFEMGQMWLPKIRIEKIPDLAQIVFEEKITQII